MPQTAVSSFTDAQAFLLLTIILFVVQALYKIWDKKDSRKVIAEIHSATSSALKEYRVVTDKTLETFSLHLEHVRRISVAVKEIKTMHEVRDEDGRFIWYMPKEVIDTQRQLVALAQTLSTTQGYIAKLIEQHSAELKEYTKDHKETCRDHMVALKDELRINGNRFSA